LSASPLLVLERTVEVHRHLRAAGIGHAVGGALALAYHVGEPRATRDIDLNVSSDADHPELVYRLLPPGVQWDDGDVVAARRDGQVRLWWPHPDDEPPIPLDLFFPQHAFHAVVARRVETVPMLGVDVPIVSATDLAVFKMLFNRSKDWPDVEELLRYGKVDAAEAARWLATIVGQEDDRMSRFAELRRSAGQSTPPTAAKLFRRRG
jgi:hypothetical protein